MEDAIFLEEEKNLIDNLNRIDLLISKVNQKIESFNYELENSNDETRKNEIFERKYEKVLDLNRYKASKINPYFGHLVLECQGETVDVYVGDKTLYLDGKIIVYDYRNPLCVLFYSNQKSFKYNGYNYKLKIKRKLIIEDGTLVNNIEDTPIFDNLVLENRNINITKTLTSEQNRLMRFEKNKNIFIYGKNGTGKSTTLNYRLSCLNYNYPGVKINEFLYITNNPNIYLDLRKELDIENITIMSISEYYLSRLKELFTKKEIDKVKININNKYNKEIIDDKLEKKTLRLIFDKFLEEALEDIEKHKEEFKLNEKEFNDLNIYNKYKKLEEIINGKLDFELDKIKILSNNTSGWLDSIYSEVENDISKKNNSDINFYIFNNTNKKDQLMNFIKDLELKIEKVITEYTEVNNIEMNDYLKLNDRLSKNINTVINTLKNNKIDIIFEEYNFKSIIESFNKYKENIINELSKIKEELTNKNKEIEEFKLKLFRNNSYNKLVEEKTKLEEKIKDLEYKIFILLDIENKYILKFEDTYNEILNLESKFDKNYLNILEYKKYFLKVKEFILLIFKHEKHIDINDIVLDKIRCIINLFKERFNNKVHYFNFIYIELFNSICNDIKFNEVKKYKSYLNDLNYKSSNKYLYDTFSTMSKVVYYKKENELDNIDIYRLLYVSCITGYYKSFNSNYKFIFIDDIDKYSLMEIDLLKNTSLVSYFNITSNDKNYLKDVCRIIDGKIYSLNINLRNSLMVTKYINEKLGYKLKEANYIGNSVKEYKFNSYKEILDLVNTYENVVLIGEDEYLDYFKDNGVTCFNIYDCLDEYKNIVFLQKDNYSNEIKYNVYSRTLNDLIIYDISNITDGVNDIEIL